VKVQAEMESKEEMANFLLEMGFTDIEVDCALQATEYKGTEPAVEWLVEQQSRNFDFDVFSLNRLALHLPGEGESGEGSSSKTQNFQNLERLDRALLDQSGVDLEETQAIEEEGRTVTMKVKMPMRVKMRRRAVALMRRTLAASRPRCLGGSAARRESRFSCPRVTWLFRHLE